jgi:hypothetical protein
MIFSFAVALESTKKKIPDLSLPPCIWVRTSGCACKKVRHNWVRQHVGAGQFTGCAYNCVGIQQGAPTTEGGFNLVCATTGCGYSWVRLQLGATTAGLATAGCGYSWVQLQLVAATAGCGYSWVRLQLGAATAGCGYSCARLQQGVAKAGCGTTWGETSYYFIVKEDNIL